MQYAQYLTVTSYRGKAMSMFTHYLPQIYVYIVIFICLKTLYNIIITFTTTFRRCYYRKMTNYQRHRSDRSGRRTGVTKTSVLHTDTHIENIRSGKHLIQISVSTNWRGFLFSTCVSVLHYKYNSFD